MKTKNLKLRSYSSMILAMLLLVFFLGTLPTVNVQAANDTLLNTYGAKYGYIGTCINLYQLRDSSTLATLKRDYNSITLENEMKPDALLGSSARLLSVSEAKSRGYYIPDNYREQYVPQINFNTVDEVMKICYQNGLKMRAHTLVWHSQTPSWFFRSNYSGNSGFVNSSTMDARLEMYVKTVMNHVYNNQYGSVVYAWDVANEVLHANNSGWESVYGNNRTNASYVKKAFNYAYETLEYFKLTDSVKLFYNDYNTYMEVNNVITLVNYINQGKKVCAGVGMQSHLGTGFPSVDYYTTALNSFLKAGFEVQLTEMDITNKGDQDLSNYAYSLFKNINAAKKNGGKITSITWWGLSDQTTWISGQSPLLFTRPGSAKPAYSKVIQAFTETFGNNVQPDPTPTPTPQPDPTPDPTPSYTTAHLDDGWYYIKNTMSQKYLTVDADNVSGWKNVVIKSGSGVDAQKWYLTNVSDGYVTLTSKLGNAMLDLANGEADNGTNVGIYQAYGGNAQQFVIKTTNNNGVYAIGTKATSGGKVLDVYEKKSEDGTNVVQWADNGGTNQQWQFEKTDGSSQQPVVEPDPEPTPEPTPDPEPTPEPDPDPIVVEGDLSLDYSINRWVGGAMVSFKVINNSGNAVNTWTLKIKKSDCPITSSWNVNVKESGNYYVITPVEWNSYIPNGSQIEFGAIVAESVSDSISYTLD